MEREHEKLKLMIQPWLVTGPAKQLSPHRWFSPSSPPRHFLTIISVLASRRKIIVLRWIVRCGSDNYGLHLIHARSTEPFSAYITRVNGNAGGGIARLNRKVKFPSLWEGWDDKIPDVSPTMKRRHVLDTCAFGVHASRASSRARVTDYKRRVIRAETKREELKWNLPVTEHYAA